MKSAQYTYDTIAELLFIKELLNCSYVILYINVYCKYLKHQQRCNKQGISIFYQRHQIRLKIFQLRFQPQSMLSVIINVCSHKGELRHRRRSILALKLEVGL